MGHSGLLFFNSKARSKTPLSRPPSPPLPPVSPCPLQGRAWRGGAGGRALYPDPGPATSRLLTTDKQFSAWAPLATILLRPTDRGRNPDHPIVNLPFRRHFRLASVLPASPLLRLRGRKWPLWGCYRGLGAGDWSRRRCQRGEFWVRHLTFPEALSAGRSATCRGRDKPAAARRAIMARPAGGARTRPETEGAALRRRGRLRAEVEGTGRCVCVGGGGGGGGVGASEDPNPLPEWEKGIWTG